MVKGAIITIGDELLSGLVLDSNALFLEELLLRCGIDPVVKFTVKDEAHQIKKALSFASQISQIILLSGGLGPTEDDVTREAVAEFCGVSLNLDEKAWEIIKSRLEERRVFIRDSHKKQALIPEGAISFANPIGTAWGFAIKRNKNWIIALPGVPKELILMGEEKVLPLLKKTHPKASSLMVKVLKTFGLKESDVNHALYDMQKKNPGKIGLMIKDYVEVHIKLTASDNEIENLEKEVKDKLGNFVFGENNETLESVAGKLLKEKGLSISTAESCTGGMLAHTITNVPDSSKYFVEGLVTYTEEAKRKELSVPEEVLKRFGAVSSECAFYMVKGLVEKTRTDIGISITGVAGPTGGTKEKPVGLVYIGYAFPTGIEVKKYYFSSDRLGVKTMAVKSALDTVRRYLLGLKI